MGTGENFEQKLSKQLETASEDVRWLVCELLAVYFLFAVGAIGGPTKRAILETVIEPLDEERPSHWQRLAEAMDEGIGNPGLGYNVRRDLQLGYLLDFCLRFKVLADAEERRKLLDDPWALRDFADDAGEGIAVREMRHILLHLLRPAEFEPMSSRTHKQNIVNAFADELLAGDTIPEDLDEQLLADPGGAGRGLEKRSQAVLFWIFTGRRCVTSGIRVAIGLMAPAILISALQEADRVLRASGHRQDAPNP